MLQLAIAPRKPERFVEVARLIESRGYACVRRSQHPDGAALTAASDRPRVFLGDTLGELRKLYSVASVVFIGRTLVPMGGSDPMEVAALAKPILLGPHFDNFDAPVRALDAAGALRIVRSIPELVQAVSLTLNHPHEALEMGRRAQQVVLTNRGATDRTADRLADIVHSRYVKAAVCGSKPLPSATVLD
jgi:3-deoxy-D-manno-octulosonic-acid transferase